MLKRQGHCGSDEACCKTGADWQKDRVSEAQQCNCFGACRIESSVALALRTTTIPRKWFQMLSSRLPKKDLILFVFRFSRFRVLGSQARLWEIRVCLWKETPAR